MGTYIETFYEGNEGERKGWETRHAELKKLSGAKVVDKTFTLNLLLAVLYLILGLISLSLPWFKVMGDSLSIQTLQGVFLLLSALLWLVPVILLFAKYPDPEHYITQWRRIRDSERPSQRIP
jgi:NAD-dependent oxidoreductase involved in siderophore biosynthesis